ncbi:MAG: GNAT family N-acetyltransferase [Bacteroidales bacterium]|nr:GNAT family N-acetyltransferase [Bacteroidales bacterium]
MDAKKVIEEIWAEAFDDSPAYRRMYFDNVYSPQDALTLQDDHGHVVSSMLLQRYSISFQGRSLPMAYIAGAATRRNYRHQGHGTRLMRYALETAYDRGDAFAALIPASDHLYFFYDRLGFLTVFYVDRRHYVPDTVISHRGDHTLHDLTLPIPESLVEAIHSWEIARAGSVRHTPEQWANIVRDASMDHGFSFWLSDDDTGTPVAVAVVTPGDDRMIVKDIVGQDENARRAMLQAIVTRFKDKSLSFLAEPSQGRPLESRGMARIVNVLKVLQAVAAANPKYTGLIRVHDPILPENEHVYRLRKGQCVIDDEAIAGVAHPNDLDGSRLSLDVPVNVLTSIVFSSEKIGDIFNLATRRPFISLMLD